MNDDSFKTFDLCTELGSIKYLLNKAHELTVHGVPFESSKDAIFATYSIGSEKLIKIALGFLEIQQGKTWPTTTILKSGKNGWGHNVAKMSKRFLDEVKPFSANLETKKFINQVICTLENDQVLKHLLEAFEAYGTQGRFFHLDAVSGQPQDPNFDPSKHWDKAENLLLEQDELLQKSYKESGITAEVEEQLLTAVSSRLQRWWAGIALILMHGCLGENGKKAGADVLPDHAIPFKVDPLCEG